MHFPEQLIAWRRHRSLTQVQLSRKTGISQPNIAAIEAGRIDPKLSTLRRLAQALEVEPGVLLDERPPQSPWGRQRIDALVRQAVAARPSFETRDAGTAKGLRFIAAHKMTAAGHPVPLRGRTGERLAKRLRAELGPSLWEAIVRRLDKHL